MIRRDENLNWRKSSASGNGACVEVCISDDDVKVRNSRSPEVPHLSFTIEEWRAFLFGAVNQEFDVPES